jgi:chromosome segregation ATPase
MSLKKITNTAAKFKNMRQTALLLGFLIALSSCNNVQSRLDKAEKEIEYAEQNKEEMTAKDWSNLEKKMQELESDLEQNRDKYTDEQVKEIGALQGRYFAVAVKKGIDDFQESVKDLGNQMDGFIEGIKSDTDNKTSDNE